MFPAQNSIFGSSLLYQVCSVRIYIFLFNTVFNMRYLKGLTPLSVLCHGEFYCSGDLVFVF